MSSLGSINFAAGLHSDAVSNATGKGWKEWFVLLDSAGAVHLPHQEIEKYLQENQGLSHWWSRMVTNGYEQACGRRDVDAPDKTLSVRVARSYFCSAEALFKAWADERIRQHWLPGHSILIRKASPHSSMRITWSDETTGLVVEFTRTDAVSSLLSVRHIHLPSQAQADKMRDFWADALMRLALLMEA